MKSFFSDRRVQVALAAVLVVVIIGVFLATRSPSGDTTTAADESTSTVSSVASTETSSIVTTTTSTATTGSTTPPPPVPVTPTVRDVHFPLADLPLTVKASDTSGLKDGDKVSFHIVPTASSQVFGVSVRLCEGAATFPALDDFEPATAGKCIGHALSPNSDLLVESGGSPPYQALDAEFRVGVGTDSFQMTDGTPVTITCGPENPCQLVLLLQVPNAFGFQTYPVTYR